MTKYVVAILVGVAALAGLLIFIGETSQLVLTSTSPRPFLAFEAQLSWRFVIVALTILLILICLVWSLIGWLIRLPSRVKSGVGKRRRTQALDAMEDALIAGAEGDQAKARKRAERARELIMSKALGQIVSAQAADASGDSHEAIAQYSAMLDDERTRKTGQRGLAQQFLNTGDLSGAIDHAGHAYRDDKNAKWAFDILFQAQLSDHRWLDAADTLSQAMNRKHIAKDTAQRRRAVLLTAEASQLAKADQRQSARDMVLSAVSEASDFAPAVALATALLGAEGERKKAANLIEKAWAQSPHPALTLALRDLFKDAEPKIWKRQIKSLLKLNPEHRETVIFQVEEALRSSDAVSAWSTLSPLVSGDVVSERLCVLAAKTERMLNNPGDARVWIERAATAPTEPDWSDLDPEGDAFEYSPQDWRRLVFSYGERGELIHPRFETGAARRRVLRDVTIAEGIHDGADTGSSAVETQVEPSTTDVPETSADKTPEPDEAFRQPDDPGPDNLDLDTLGIDEPEMGDLDLGPPKRSRKTSTKSKTSKRNTDDLAQRLDSLLDDSGNT